LFLSEVPKRDREPECLQHHAGHDGWRAGMVMAEVETRGCDNKTGTSDREAGEGHERAVASVATHRRSAFPR
jgi:hypothetical protein